MTSIGGIVIRSFPRRAAAVATAGLLVLASSLTPWFRTRYAANDGFLSNTANAWQCSAWWSLAVALCVLAAGLGVFTGTRLSRHVPAGLATAALVVTIVQWYAIEPMPTGRGGSWVAADSASDAEAGGVGDIVYNHLQTVHIDGLDYDFGWGLYAGIITMTALTVLLWTRRG